MKSTEDELRKALNLLEERERENNVLLVKFETLREAYNDLEQRFKTQNEALGIEVARKEET